MKGFAGGLFCMCVGFHCPICVLYHCYNGAAFPRGELRSFLGFLFVLTELVRVTLSIMLQSWKYGQNL
jgi:hypothetical protein